MPELLWFYNRSLWTFGIVLAAYAVFIWLFVVGDARYGRRSGEIRIEEFGGVATESFGRSTLLLWLCEGILLLWTIYYFALNWQQFLVIFAFPA